MKTRKLLALIISLLPVAAIAGEINFEFEGVEDYTDFSVSGLSEERTLPLLEAELEDEISGWTKKYLTGDQVLTIRITDIDMAGDIQPWRNTYSADIRYVEPVYPPRIKLSYTLADADGNIIKEGEDSLADLGFQQSTITALRMKHQNFGYELELLRTWMRRTFP